MKKCIICGKPESKFGKDNLWSEEHIIPDALGGKIKITDCCKKCNSLLGKKVDANFINYKMTEFIRCKLKIKGKNGVPNPINQLEDHFIPGLKGHFILNENGDFEKFEFIKKPIVDTENCLAFAGNKVDEEKMWEALKKNEERNNRKPVARVQIEVCVRETPRPYMWAKWSKDARDSFAVRYWMPELVKIAYEFTYYALKEYSLSEEYLDDSIAKDIQNFLNTLIYEKNLDSVNIPTDIELYASTKSVKKENSISFYSEGNNIICKVNILNYAFGEVVVAGDADKFSKICGKEYKLEI